MWSRTAPAARCRPSTPVAGKTGTNGVTDKGQGHRELGLVRRLHQADLHRRDVRRRRRRQRAASTTIARPGDSTFFGGTYPALTWADYMDDRDAGPVGQGVRPARVGQRRQGHIEPRPTIPAPPRQPPRAAGRAAPRRVRRAPSPPAVPATSRAVARRPKRATARARPSGSATKGGAHGNGGRPAAEAEVRDGGRAASRPGEPRHRRRSRTGSWPPSASDSVVRSAATPGRVGLVEPRPGRPVRRPPWSTWPGSCSGCPAGSPGPARRRTTSSTSATPTSGCSTPAAACSRATPLPGLRRLPGAGVPGPHRLVPRAGADGSPARWAALQGTALTDAAAGRLDAGLRGRQHRAAGRAAADRGLGPGPDRRRTGRGTP